MRDVVITEYGIAYIRGKSDEEIAKALINISDSRFQQELLSQAKSVGKIEKDYQIPKEYTHNYPASYDKIINEYKKSGDFPVFPFGTDLTDEEIVVGKALKGLAKIKNNKIKLLTTILKSLFVKVEKKHIPYLKRMNLYETGKFQEHLYRRLLVYQMNQ
jgi:hypothetical protein